MAESSWPKNKPDKLKPTILLVDDKEENLLALEVVLQELDCRLVKCTSGEAAIESLLGNDVALILLDVQMPRMDGFETARRIRRFKDGSSAPIIFISAIDRSEEHLERAHEAGGLDLVFKPVSAKVLISKARVFLDLFQTRKELKDVTESRHFLDGEGEMAKRFREMDWSSSPLGPVDSWDQSLKTAVGLMLRSAFPIFVSWGPDRVFLYNDAYRPILGTEKHPQAFGSKFETIWKEIWPDLEPIVLGVDEGKSSYFEDLPLRMNRHGYAEQTYFTFSYSPILNDMQKVGGLFCSCVETTNRKKTENALRESEERLRLTAEEALVKSARLETVIGTMTEGMIFIDPSGVILRMNNEALRSHGFSDHSEMIKDLSDYRRSVVLRTPSGEELPFHDWPASRVLRGERFSSYEVQLEDRRSGRNWIGNFGGAPINDSAGQLLMGVITVRDVTEQKQNEHKIRASESRLQLIIETVPQGIWRTNPDGSADYFSERFYENVGYTAEEFLGWGWSEVIHSDDRQRVLAEWQRCRDLKIPVSFDFRLLRKDGTHRWYLSLGNPFFDENGALTKYYGTWTDIHAEKLARAELELKSDAVEHSLHGFDIVNAKGEFIYANQSYLKMWGYDSLDEIIGTSPVGHCEDPGIPEKIIRSLKERGNCDIEFKARRKDGSTFHVHMWAWLTHDADGHEIYPTTSIDVTEQKIAERELRLAKEEAERANELKSAFLANMSHEIRTPLGAMIGFADLLRDSGLSEAERKSYLDVLIRNGEQLSVIINDILDLSKVEAGHLTLEFVETDPAQIATDVVSLLGMKAKEKGLTLRSEIDSTAPKTLVSDPVRVRQILLNLVGNAVKFTQAGNVTIKAYGIENEFGQTSAAFEISDTGIGVPADQRERIFDVFVQADGSMTRRFGGTGLGLALSRRLARALGGDIIVKATSLGEGSTFLFTFKDHPENREIESVREIQPQMASTIAKEQALKNVRVLVVDDAPDNQQLLRRYLTKQGAFVDLADNGLDGYKMALAGGFDIVLMDIQMPQMDGYTATQKLRELGFRKPVIALTAHAMTEVRKKCMNIGCSDFIAKPINPQELITAVSRAVRDN